MPLADNRFVRHLARFHEQLFPSLVLTILLARWLVRLAAGLSIGETMTITLEESMLSIGKNFVDCHTGTFWGKRVKLFVSQLA